MLIEDEAWLGPLLWDLERGPDVLVVDDVWLLVIRHITPLSRSTQLRSGPCPLFVRCGSDPRLVLGARCSGRQCGWRSGCLGKRCPSSRVLQGARRGRELSHPRPISSEVFGSPLTYSESGLEFLLFISEQLECIYSFTWKLQPGKGERNTISPCRLFQRNG
jgi:hypothetical protein